MSPNFHDRHPNPSPALRRRSALLVAALAAALAMPLANARPPMDGPDDGPGMHEGRDPARHWARMHERMEQRFEQLEQALKLRPEQKPVWDAFVAARPQPPQRSPEEWRQWREQMQTMGAIERHKAMEQRLEERMQQMKASGVALQKLYDVLDTSQRATLDRFQWWPGPKGMKDGYGPGPARTPAPPPAAPAAPAAPVAPAAPPAQ